MAVFMYVTQKAIDKKSVLKLRLYTLNLLMSGLVCKGYVTAIIAIR